jgi:hypothetical protein
LYNLYLIYFIIGVIKKEVLIGFVIDEVILKIDDIEIISLVKFDATLY